MTCSTSARCLPLIGFALCCDFRDAAPERPSNLVAIAGSSGNATATVSSGPTVTQPARRGETVPLPGMTVRFISQRDCGSVEPGLPSVGHRVIAVELEITNRSATPLLVSPSHATLIDDQRFRYTTSLAGCAPLLEPAPLLPSGKSRGYVPFEIPTSTVAGMLVYENPQLGVLQQPARFTLDF